MKSKAAKILEVLLERRTAFKAVLLFVMAISTIQWVHYHLAFVYRGFLVWGALIIAWDFFHGKKLWEGKTLNLLMAFCMFYAVTIFLNRETELVSNLKALAYMVILFITLYGGGKADPVQTKKERKILTAELLTFFTVLAVVCLVLFLLGFHKTYKTPDKVIGYLGTFNGRLAGMMNVLFYFGDAGPGAAVRQKTAKDLDQGVCLGQSGTVRTDSVFVLFPHFAVCAGSGAGGWGFLADAADGAGL